MILGTMLSPPNPAKELILVMGAWGSGKTFLWCKLAEWLRKTGSPAKVFVVNTDKPLDLYAYSWNNFYDNIVPLSPDPSTMVADWSEYKVALEKAQADIVPGRGDWYIIDKAESVWEQCKATFITEVKDESVSEFYLKARAQEERVLREAIEKGLQGKPLKDYLKAAGVTGPALGGAFGKDWDVINKMYREFMTPIYRLGAHVLAVTEETKFSSDEDNSHLSPELKDAYEKMGVRPKGQKGLGGAFHSCLRLQRASLDRWVVNTVRETSGPDRVRKYLVNEELDGNGHFVTKYLVKVAGWRM